MAVYRYGSAQSPGKKMPGEPGEMEAMKGAVLGWVSQGLQHEVIAMASCCKKGGGQKGNNCHRQTCTGTTGITVLMRDSGAACRIRTCDQPLRRRLLYPTELMPQRKEHSRLTCRHEYPPRESNFENALTCCEDLQRTH